MAARKAPRTVGGGGGGTPGRRPYTGKGADGHGLGYHGHPNGATTPARGAGYHGKPPKGAQMPKDVHHNSGGRKPRNGGGLRGY